MQIKLTFITASPGASLYSPLYFSHLRTFLKTFLNTNQQITPYTVCLKKGDQRNDVSFYCRACGCYRVHCRDTNNFIQDLRVYLNPTGNIFCDPIIHPTVPTGPSSEANIISLIPLFLRRPVFPPQWLQWFQPNYLSDDSFLYKLHILVADSKGAWLLLFGVLLT